KGATVFVDREPKGPAPARFELRVGVHDLVVKADGKQYRQRITSEAGVEVQVDAAFDAPTAVAAAQGPEVEPDEEDELALAPIEDGALADKSADEPDDELELAALPTPEPVPEEEGLALVPLTQEPDELELVAPDPASAPPSLDSDDELAIVPLELPRSTAVAGGDPLNPNSVSASIDDRKQWYEEWWVWTAGGAVVVAAVATSVALSSGDGSSDEVPVDGRWRPDGDPTVGPQP
ncbi:MAG: PEGA domain-containing protein, partial [Myxococcota bacterium]